MHDSALTFDGATAEEVEALRRRIGELEAERTRLWARLRSATAYPPAWGLTRQEGQVLSLLHLHSGLASFEYLQQDLGQAAQDISYRHLNVILCRLRAKLAAVGVEILNRRGQGYWLPEGSRRVLDASVVAVATGGA